MSNCRWPSPGLDGFLLCRNVLPDSLTGAVCCGRARCVGASRSGRAHIQLLPNGERTPQGKRFTYTSLGCFAEFNPADTILTQADGKKVVPADSWKRLEVGTVVLVSIDGQEVAKEFPARVKQDTLVIRVRRRLHSDRRAQADDGLGH
jgi:hypothetical protein